MTTGGNGDDASGKRERPSEPALEMPDTDRVTIDFISGPPLAFASEDEPVDSDVPEMLGLDPPAQDDEPDALGLVSRNRLSSMDLDVRAEMLECFALDDFTHALRIAELVLGGQPDDAEAQTIAKRSRERLEQLYTARLGALSMVPRLSVEPAEIRWLGLDHRAGFLLSRVDGTHTIEELLDVSGMRRLEGLKTLVELKDLGAIAL